jgi:hypothetical protein
LQAAADRNFRAPIVLLQVLKVRGRYKPGRVAPKSPGALQLNTGLRYPGFQIRWIAVKEVGAAGIQSQPIEESLGQLEVGAFEAEIQPIDGIAQKEFVTQVRTLMKDSKKRREIFYSITRGDPAGKIGIY